MQAGLESSFRPDPSKPISVNIAADFHRSNTRSKTIKGTTVLTRTIAFRTRDPTTRRHNVKKEEFEKHLHTCYYYNQKQKVLSHARTVVEILTQSHVSVQIVPTIQKPTITALTISPRTGRCDSLCIVHHSWGQEIPH